ncbi:glycoside hydrolase family 16 protein [Zavarzinia sp. CC-PAN008]|uniref:glycoside hydrolase family 16 protein n=1 Tax=Zavarzinia sp. CC-PAN008 TaxID=3243332 RepID=UPI003F7447C9
MTQVAQYRSDEWQNVITTKRFFYFVMLAMMALLALVMPVRQAEAAGWKLVFEDNFNGNTLDRTRWSTRYIYNEETMDTLAPNKEAQTYGDDNNHLVRNGQLDLIARPAPAGSKLPYQSGMLRSFQTFYYGYFEARVKFPPGIGVWPAFWLNPDRGNDGQTVWPPEIDIFEFVNNGREDKENMVHSGTHSHPSQMANVRYTYVDPKYDTKWGGYHNATSLVGGWHTFAALWTPTSLTVWMDGRKLYTQTFRWVRADGTLAPPAHINLNFALGGDWAGRHGIDPKNFPKAFSVDYVRVCQPVATGGTPTCGASRTPVTPSQAMYTSNAPGRAGDALRPVLRHVTVPRPVVQGQQLTFTQTISSPVNLPVKHEVFVYLVDAKGQVLTSALQAPIYNTMIWGNRTITLNWSVKVPWHAVPGRYSIYTAVGTRESWDPKAKWWLRAIKLDYAATVPANLRHRVNAPMRFKIGEMTVAPYTGS